MRVATQTRATPETGSVIPARLLSLENGTYDLRVTPPAGSGYATQIVQDVEIAGEDLVYDVVLLAEGEEVAGTVLGYGGEGVAGVQVRAQDPGTGTTIAETTTDETGGYSLNLSAGTYRFYLRHSEAAEFPYFYVYYYGIEASGDEPQDFNLPVVRVQGEVTDANGAPVANVQVQASSSHYVSSPQVSGWSEQSGTTDETGAYEVFAFTGTASIIITPPSDSGYVIETVSGLAVSEDVVQDFELSEGEEVAGTVLGYGGEGVAGVQVRAQDPGTGTTIAETTTDETGGYSLNLSAGTYRFYLRHSETAEFPYFYVYYYGIEASGDEPQDFNLPVARVQGEVTDANGAPVANVQVQASSSHYVSSPQVSGWSEQSGTTDETGAYEVFAFTGTASIIITPPAESGFAITALSNIALTTDRTQAVILQHPDLSPPAIVSGPVVVHLSDTSVSINWETNEPADSVVDYGIGDLSESEVSPAYVTRHEVTLLDLEPSTIYSYQATSTDEAGNGPTSSAVLTFATQDPPGDITAPVITSGPDAVSIGLDTATIVWSTDEPSTSVVHYGTDETLGSTVTVEGFTVSHSVALVGLDPETTYFYQVESTDPDGNGPTTSEIASFDTADIPDTTAPEILSGPTVTAVTDTTMTVAWTTDEPATSGVSYNDGTTFFVVTDDTLVTDHGLVLADLMPATTYEITVSSTDANGNGPTLGGPIEETTLETPDTEPPEISDVEVTEITAVSAVVSWTTDEPASSQVSFGLISGDPSGLAGSAAVVTEHSVLLTGLESDATYYFAVHSTDSAGNEGEAGEFEFDTESLDTDGDGIDDSVDNCPEDANADQADLDEDGEGDVCDEDVDGDGVVNEDDNCPRVPNEDQADEDADGIGDACDEPSDSDSDGDGIEDDEDECAGTEAGDPIDADGCSIGQLCPCDGPRDSTRDWRNHGKYVRCVVKTAQRFWWTGYISRRQKRHIVRAAARSSCGRRPCDHDPDEWHEGWWHRR